MLRLENIIWPDSRWWLVPFLIILIGLGIRSIVVFNTADTRQSSYSTLVKASLNYRWAKRELREKTGQWFDGKEYYNHMYTLDAGSLDFVDLHDQLKLSNHPPLYYDFLHIISAWTSGLAPSIVYGLLFNVFLSVFTMLLFYRIAYNIFDSRLLASLSLIILAFSLPMMFALTAIKGYELLTIFILAQFYLVCKHVDVPHLKNRDFFWFFLACLGGFLTHYYAYIFTAFLSLILGANYLLLDFKPKRLVLYAVITVAAVGLAVAIYPNIINDLMGAGRSLQIQEKLIDSSKIVNKPSVIFERLMFLYSFPIKLLGVVALIGTVIAIVKRDKWISHTHKKIALKISYATAFALVSVIFIMRISPNGSLRYVAPIVPLLILPIVYGFQTLVSIRGKVIIMIGIILLSHSLYQINQVLIGNKKSEEVIRTWKTQKPFYLIALNEPVMLVVQKTGEHIRPWLFHLPPREVAISLKKLNISLLAKRENAVVLLAFGKISVSKDAVQNAQQYLLSAGYEKQGRILRFYLYRKK